MLNIFKLHEYFIFIPCMPASLPKAPLRREVAYQPAGAARSAAPGQPALENAVEYGVDVSQVLLPVKQLPELLPAQVRPDLAVLP
jgi:hypothetical protein